MSVREGRLHTLRADPPQGDVSFSGRTNDMAAALYGPLPLPIMVAAGRIGFEGDPARGQGFVDLFSLRSP